MLEVWLYTFAEGVDLRFVGVVFSWYCWGTTLVINWTRQYGMSTHGSQYFYQFQFGSGWIGLSVIFVRHNINMRYIGGGD